MILRILLLMLLVLACSCSFEGQGGKAAPPVSAGAGTGPATTRQGLFQILPQEAARGAVFYAVAQADVLQRGVVTWTII
jgi:hypothetical protein